MHKTKRNNKHFKKTRKVRKKIQVKKYKYNYCKKGMTDEGIRIYNLLKEAKKQEFKYKKNKTENEPENENNTNKNKTNDQ